MEQFSTSRRARQSNIQQQQQQQLVAQQQQQQQQQQQVATAAAATLAAAQVAAAQVVSSPAASSTGSPRSQSPCQSPSSATNSNRSSPQLNTRPTMVPDYKNEFHQVRVIHAEAVKTRRVPTQPSKSELIVNSNL